MQDGKRLGIVLQKQIDELQREAEDLTKAVQARESQARLPACYLSVFVLLLLIFLRVGFISKDAMRKARGRNTVTTSLSRCLDACYLAQFPHGVEE